MKITVRPYSNDTTRHHVDVRIEDPTTTEKKYIRRRLVAPRGMDSSAAKSWGEQQAKEILRKIVRQTRGEQEETTPTKRNVSTHGEPNGGHTGSATDMVSRYMTMSEFWDRFWSGYVVRRKLGTRQNYERAWRHYFKPLLGHLPLDLIDRRMCALVRTAARDKGLGAGSINQLQEKLRRALRWAVSEGLAPDSVIPRIERETIPRTLKEIYSEENLEQLLDAAENVKDEALILLAWHGALRIGEIAALQWADINWTSGIMMISRNICKTVLQESPKGEIGPVPMSPQLVAILKRMQRGDGSIWVFPRNRNTSLSYWTDRAAAKRMKTLQRKAGLPVFGPHRIRHSVLTHLANRGISPYALQAFARHSSMKTTMRYYIHLDKAAMAAVAVAALNDSAHKKAKPTRGKARGKAMANSGNTPEFCDRALN